MISKEVIVFTYIIVYINTLLGPFTVKIMLWLKIVRGSRHKTHVGVTCYNLLMSSFYLE